MHGISARQMTRPVSLGIEWRRRSANPARQTANPAELATRRQRRRKIKRSERPIYRRRVVIERGVRRLARRRLIRARRLHQRRKFRRILQGFNRHRRQFDARRVTRHQIDARRELGGELRHCAVVASVAAR